MTVQMVKLLSNPDDKVIPSRFNSVNCKQKESKRRQRYRYRCILPTVSRSQCHQLHILEFYSSASCRKIVSTEMHPLVLPPTLANTRSHLSPSGSELWSLFHTLPQEIPPPKSYLSAASGEDAPRKRFSSVGHVLPPTHAAVSWASQNHTGIALHCTGPNAKDSNPWTRLQMASLQVGTLLPEVALGPPLIAWGTHTQMR